MIEVGSPQWLFMKEQDRKNKLEKLVNYLYNKIEGDAVIDFFELKYLAEEFGVYNLTHHEAICVAKKVSDFDF